MRLLAVRLRVNAVAKDQLNCAMTGCDCDDLRLEELCDDPFVGEYPDPWIDPRNFHAETMSEYDIMKKVVLPFLLLPHTEEETHKIYEDIIAMGTKHISDEDTLMQNFNDRKIAYVRERRRLKRAMRWIEANIPVVYHTGRFTRQELHDKLWCIICDPHTVKLW